MKGEKLDRFIFEIVRALRYPDNIRIGCIEEKLKDAIKVITEGNKTIRTKVYEQIDAIVESEFDYDTSIYGNDVEKAKSDMKSDYDILFYKK